MAFGKCLHASWPLFYLFFFLTLLSLLLDMRTDLVAFVGANDPKVVGCLIRNPDYITDRGTWVPKNFGFLRGQPGRTGQLAPTGNGFFPQGGRALKKFPGAGSPWGAGVFAKKGALVITPGGGRRAPPEKGAKKGG